MISGRRRADKPDIPAQVMADILHENAVRMARLRGDYDPVTGRDAPCGSARVLLEIPDFALPQQWVPVEMMSNRLVHDVARAGGVGRYVSQWKGGGRVPTEHDIELELRKVRSRYDFVFWAYWDIRIKHKRGGRKRFKLNYAQAKVLEVCERLRLAGQPIDIIICKARQWGGSTFSIFYQTWIAFKHNPSHSFVVAAQTKPVAQGITRMLSAALRDYPAWEFGLPESEKLSLDQMDGTCWTVRDSKKNVVQDHEIYLGTIKEPDGVRGFAVSGAHLSEVGIWDDTPARRASDLVSDISGGILPQPLTMQVMESTAKGEGFFKDEWDRAQSGESIFTPVFVPWYYIEFDTIPIQDMEEFVRWLWLNRTSEEAPAGWRSPGRYYWWLWEQGATLEGINWYRYKERSYTDRASMEHEAPSDDIEAFRSSGNLVFDTWDVERLRKGCREPAYSGVLLSDEARGEGVLKHIRFVMQQGGPLKVWEFPDRDASVSDRYLVVVDVGGRSRNADWSVIRVLDRFMMTYDGGCPEIVAQMRYHTDHDLLAYDAARIAQWYNNALLVIESNTLETRDQERDVDGNMTDYILDTLSEIYDNLYARESGKGEDIEQGKPRKWGWHTNVDTKPRIIANMQACLRDSLWVERDRTCCTELAMYEKNARGQFSAPPGRGKHDDVLMATAIGLWICFHEMERPAWTEDRGERPGRDEVSAHSMASL